MTLKAQLKNTLSYHLAAAIIEGRSRIALCFSIAGKYSVGSASWPSACPSPGMAAVASSPAPAESSFSDFSRSPCLLSSASCFFKSAGCSGPPAYGLFSGEISDVVACVSFSDIVNFSNELNYLTLSQCSPAYKESAQSIYTRIDYFNIRLI